MGQDLSIISVEKGKLFHNKVFLFCKARIYLLHFSSFLFLLLFPLCILILEIITIQKDLTDSLWVYT